MSWITAPTLPISRHQADAEAISTLLKKVHLSLLPEWRSHGGSFAGDDSDSGTLL